MGFYLTTPIKDKSTSSNKTTKLSYVASSMQGIICNINSIVLKDGGQVWRILISQN